MLARKEDIGLVITQNSANSLRNIMDHLPEIIFQLEWASPPVQKGTRRNAESRGKMKRLMSSKGERIVHVIEG